MSIVTPEGVEQGQNPYPVPEKQSPSEYDSVEEYVEQVKNNPDAFLYHCIEEARAVALDDKYIKECMSHTGLGVLFFAVRNNPYLIAAKEGDEKLDETLFGLKDNSEVLALLKRLSETREKIHNCLK